MSTVSVENVTFNASRPTGIATPINILALGMLSTSCLVGVVGNVCILVALATDWHLKKRKFFMEIVLCAIGLAACIVWVPFQIQRLDHRRHFTTDADHMTCLINSFVHTTFSIASALFISLLGAKKMVQLHSLSTKLQVYVEVIGTVSAIAISLLFGILSVTNGKEDWLIYITCMHRPPAHTAEGIILSTFYCVLLASIMTIQLYSLCAKKESGTSQRTGKYGQDNTPSNNGSVACVSHTEASSQVFEIRQPDNLQIPQFEQVLNDGLPPIERAVTPRLIYVQGNGIADQQLGQTQKNHQKKSFRKQLSVRRHTVAKVDSGKVQSEHDYKYIRKYSVDPAALMNQLENPKMHGGNYPFFTQQSSLSKQSVNQDHQHQHQDDSPSEELQQVAISNCTSIEALSTSQHTVSETDDHQLSYHYYRSLVRYTIFIAISFLFFLPYPIVSAHGYLMDAATYWDSATVTMAACMVPNIVFSLAIPYVDMRIGRSISKLHKRWMNFCSRTQCRKCSDKK